MKYICHKRFKKKGASGKDYNISRGAELETVGNFIALGSEAVCTVNSFDAFYHFARNDDEKGLERGELTFAIAFSDRKPNKDNGYRFTPEQQEIICKEYSHFIVKDMEYIIFNYDFFNAEIEVLKEIADKLFGKEK